MVSPKGFSMIEVLIAMTLFGIALLGVAGSAILAGQVMNQAHARERSTLEALQIIDSLTRVREPSSGQRLIGRMQLRWTVSASSSGPAEIEVIVEYPDGGALRTARFRTTHAHAGS
ncbi:MAG: prepilin-type N-terminal cleavage/methylation domain-containing protein [Gemmatimonadota bacterium]